MPEQESLMKYLKVSLLPSKNAYIFGTKIRILFNIALQNKSLLTIRLLLLRVTEIVCLIHCQLYYLEKKTWQSIKDYRVYCMQ